MQEVEIYSIKEGYYNIYSKIVRIKWRHSNKILSRSITVVCSDMSLLTMYADMPTLTYDNV